MSRSHESRCPSADVRIELLGGFALAVGGVARPLTSAKARLLLARLVLAERRSVARESLAALLWSDVPQEQARANLRQCLVQARQGLDAAADVLVADSERVALDTARVETDIDVLRAAAEGGAPTHAERLVRGDLLEGIPARGHELADWLAAEREQVRFLQLQVLDRLAEDAMAAHDLETAARLTLHGLALDPLREPAHRRMMQIYAVRGDHARALHQFETCRDLLRQDLDVAPEPQTMAAYEEIKQQRSAPAPAAARAASATAGPAAGEDAELREVVVLCAIGPEEGDPEAEAEVREEFRVIAARAGSEGAPVEIESDEVDLLLVFGLDRAHEDDALHALRAGRSILDAAPGARLGIAAGRVLCEPGAKRRISGEVRRRAARLAAAAAPGELVCDASLSSLMAAAPGEIETAPAHGVLRPRPPFVGRAIERRQIAGLLEAAGRGEGGAVVLVAGEAGIGKSRLTQECAEAFAAEGGRVVRVGFSGFGAVGQAFAQRLSRALAGEGGPVAADESAPLAATRSWLLGTPPPPGGEALLAAMDEARLAELTAAVLVDQLGEGPAAGTLAVIEDTHWADRADLDLVLRIASDIERRKVVVIVTERQSEARLAPMLRQSTMDTEVLLLELAPLSQRDGRALAEAMGRNDEAFVADAIARAGGNALFLVRLLEAGPDRAAATPPSIVSLVQAQTNDLPDRLRWALRRAAVLGQSFAVEDFAEVFGAADLDALAARGFLIPEDGRMTFAHALVHEAVYTSVTRADRRTMHAKAADHFRTRDPLRWADHALLASDPEAAAACAAAADTLLPRYEFERGERYIAAGLAAQGSEGDARASLLLSRGSLRRERGELEGAIADYEAAAACAVTPTFRIRALAKMCWVHRLRGDLDAADRCLDDADAADQSGVDADILAEVWHQRGNQAFARGDAAGCETCHTRATELAQTPVWRSRALGGLGDAHYAAGRMHSARRHFSKCVKLARDHGLGVVEMANAHMEALCVYFDSPGPEAFALIDLALERATQADNLRNILIASLTRAEMLAWAGQREACRDQLEAIDRLMDRLGGTRFDSEIGYINAVAAIYDDDRAGAASRASRAIAGLSDNDRGHIGAALYGVLATACDDDTEAVRAIEAGEDLLSQGSLGHAHFWFRLHAGDALIRHRRCADVEGQAAALESYTAGEPLAWTGFAIRRMRLLARFASGDSSAQDMKAAEKLARELDAASLGAWSIDLRKTM